MKLSKKGTTVVELVVSVSMLFVIAIFLFQIIISLKEVYNSSGIKTEMLNKQAVISKIINDDLRNKKLEIALNCNLENTCLSLYFADGTSKNLELIPKNDENPTAYFIYGDYKTELVSGSNYDFSIDTNGKRSYEIKSETILNATGLNNSILYIHIGIKHPMLKNEDFGINITYQYNDKTTSIPALELSVDSTSISNFYLLGNSTMIGYTSVDFIDPGYFYLDENQNFVKVLGTDDAYNSNEYVSVVEDMIDANTKEISYISRIDGTVLATRTVKYINTMENFEYNGSYHEFRAPVSGTYNIELWGANGGSTSLGAGGIGAYTSGNIKLSAGEKVYVYVGGAPSGDNGGYNGGGTITTHQSENGGAAGGGATDVRLEAGSWDSAEGLKSRIMVAAGGGAAKTVTCGSISAIGGHGGALTSETPDVGTSCENTIWTLTGGASQNAGGTLKIYTNGTASSPYQAGLFGKAGSASQFSGDIISGGGGGYYGGANAGYGSFATGGSSFISGCEKCVAITSNGTPADNSIHYSGKYFTNTNMVAGNSISGNENITKPVNNNNGYARIKLVSVTYGTEEEQILDDND